MEEKSKWMTEVLGMRIQMDELSKWMSYPNYTDFLKDDTSSYNYHPHHLHMSSLAAAKNTQFQMDRHPFKQSCSKDFNFFGGQILDPTGV